MNILSRLAKAYLKSIPTKDDFNNLIERLILTDNEKEVLRRVYLNNENLGIIADDMGYSIQNIKKIHSSALVKIGGLVISNRI